MMDSPGRYASVEAVYVAAEKGFFRAEGLELELAPLLQQSAWAFTTGTVDFSAGADYIYIVNVFDKGLKSLQVTSSLPHIDPRCANDGMLVLDDSPIHGPADLWGKTIAMTSVWDSCAWFTLDYAARVGLTYDDLNYLGIPARQQEQVLTSGHVDAVFAFSPADALLRRKSQFRQLFSTADIRGRRIARGSTMVQESFARNSPEIGRLRRAVSDPTLDR
jgi:ABC-type nitrate/sulfonate/bicarbonate transport system substrate-binding protein